MDAIHFQKSISLEQYQMAVRVLEALGLEVKEEFKSEFTSKELSDLEISNQQVKENKVISSKDLKSRLSAKYGY